MIQKNIGEMIAILIKSKDITQTELAEKLGVPHSQINPFLRGHKDVYASTLVSVLKEIGIDVENQLKEKLKLENNIEQTDLKTPSDAITFLFGKMDKLTQETCLNHMLFSVKNQESGVIPLDVETKIKSHLALI